jgi:D-erythronate 2-dehydrogenase
MNIAARHVVVTGASGFVGSRLVARLLADPAFAAARFSLNDRALATSSDPRVRTVPGDFGDPVVREALIDGRADIVYHLGGVLGGAAENDPALARAVNVDATLSLFEALYDATNPPRVVFTSSIAVFGAPLPAVIDDATRPNPTMLYGAQKAMMEVALEQASARGWIDGLALRLPGIVVKPHADARMKSAFINRVFEAHVAGDDLVMPVSADGTTWLMSVSACIDALIHGGLVAADRLGARRALTLPAQNVRFGDLIAALRTYFPDSPTTITYKPDADIEAQFGRQPPLTTPIADRLGFVHDGDLATLVARGLQEIHA